MTDATLSVAELCDSMKCECCCELAHSETLCDVLLAKSIYTQECENLMAKGISGTGEGFDAPGKRLGGMHHNPPATGLRQAALAAAEKRARTGALMPPGPRRLGGDSSIMKDLSPIQAAAMAAERRQRDDLWCKAPVTSAEDGFEREQAVVEAAAGEEVRPPPSVSQTDEDVEIVDKPQTTGLPSSSMTAHRKGKAIAVDQEQHEFQHQNGKRGGEAGAKVAHGVFHPLAGHNRWQGNGSSSASQQQSDYSPAGTSQPLSDDFWTCSLCTLINPARLLVTHHLLLSRVHSGRTDWADCMSVSRELDSFFKNEICTTDNCGVSLLAGTSRDLWSLWNRGKQARGCSNLDVFEMHSSEPKPADKLRGLRCCFLEAASVFTVGFFLLELFQPGDSHHRETRSSSLHPEQHFIAVNDSSRRGW